MVLKYSTNSNEEIQITGSEKYLIMKDDFSKLK